MLTSFNFVASVPGKCSGMTFFLVCFYVRNGSESIAY